MITPREAFDVSTRQSTLALARRGTEFFDRELHALTDDELDGDSLLPGWARRQVVAHVASNARALGRLAQWADTGIETVMYASLEARNAEIAAGSILSPDALRESWAGSAADLDHRWQSLPVNRWSASVRNGQGATIPLRDSIWMRAREVWIHAVDLNHGADFEDLPGEVLTRLLRDIVEVWTARGDAGYRLTATDSANESYGSATAVAHVTGSLAELAAWAAGRGSNGVVSSTGETPVAPRWL
ncbi:MULTISPECIES: maleylpyruvate isomerase family mycothiol-dependent enzyme [Cryobacterium]|uniref:Maleylpyruvate isomerase family mycothiol-dependent enzyme n=1 Tax=Cryobacterium breve TaxID=1259258 RepID=A0ABY2IVW1_9MICO|nr:MULTISPECIES: maleylpyruvate isomerase family mycothiol-dependent enzyme [Cryobacterium]TFC90564.1 maleylpyruvate isomerase family mycothiol-dependent enzyme [Cryobacterium sp. TmT3-12]TFC95642.1 maleylpyruvate isomerase family mycothiol-dependent enzyme [Cryobacterium breve]